MDNTRFKIAVVTDDGNTIHRHFGRAQYYMIYSIEDGKVTSKQQVDKAHHHGHHHHQDTVQVDDINGNGHKHNHNHDHDHQDMFRPLQDCSVLLTRGMGRGAFIGLMNMDVEPVITTIGNIDEAIQAYLDGSLVNHLEKLH